MIHAFVLVFMIMNGGVITVPDLASRRECDNLAYRYKGIFYGSKWGEYGPSYVCSRYLRAP